MAELAKVANDREGRGWQRLELAALRRWEELRYGMLLCFGMSTFDGDELSKGDRPSSLYAPTALDVDQWVSVARDAGMKYAVLTTKHVAGHALWPTKHSDYQVGTSGNKTDVVEAFVKACAKRGVMPSLYYCSWDNHHLLGSMTPTFTKSEHAFTTEEYRAFQRAQVEELLTQYGKIGQMWIDIPGVLGADGRRKQYEQVARLQPECLVMMNNSFGDGTKLNEWAWPTDLMAIERALPSSAGGYQPWHEISDGGLLTVGAASAVVFRENPAKAYYLPGEVGETIGHEWFWTDGDKLRSDGELLGMRLICTARRANLMLSVPPSRRGVIEEAYVGALMRLAKHFSRMS